MGRSCMFVDRFWSYCSYLDHLQALAILRRKRNVSFLLPTTEFFNVSIKCCFIVKAYESFVHSQTFLDCSRKDTYKECLDDGTAYWTGVHTAQTACAKDHFLVYGKMQCIFAFNLATAITIQQSTTLMISHGVSVWLQKWVMMHVHFLSCTIQIGCRASNS